MKVDVIVRGQGCSSKVYFASPDGLTQEIHRVLCPGGVMEAAEEGKERVERRNFWSVSPPTPDIRFPTLPKWFTTPLRAHAKRTEMIHLPDGSSQPSSPIPSGSKHLDHDHALLESLYYSVFETRFVNTRPTGAPFTFPDTPTCFILLMTT